MERKQITLRIPDKVYEALRAEAEGKGIAINELILLKVSVPSFGDSFFIRKDEGDV